MNKYLVISLVLLFMTHVLGSGTPENIKLPEVNTQCENAINIKNSLKDITQDINTLNQNLFVFLEETDDFLRIIKRDKTLKNNIKIHKEKIDKLAKEVKERMISLYEDGIVFANDLNAELEMNRKNFEMKKNSIQKKISDSEDKYTDFLKRLKKSEEWLTNKRAENTSALQSSKSEIERLQTFRQTQANKIKKLQEDQQAIIVNIQNLINGNKNKEEILPEDIKKIEILFTQAEDTSQQAEKIIDTDEKNQDLIENSLHKIEEAQLNSSNPPEKNDDDIVKELKNIDTILQNSENQ